MFSVLYTIVNFYTICTYNTAPEFIFFSFLLKLFNNNK